jgi:hypothetical protein
MHIIKRLSTLGTTQGAQAVKLMQEMLPFLSSEPEPLPVAAQAGEFTIDKIVQVFGLDYTITPSNMEQHNWKIE